MSDQIRELEEKLAMVMIWRLYRTAKENPKLPPLLDSELTLGPGALIDVVKHMSNSSMFWEKVLK